MHKSQWLKRRWQWERFAAWERAACTDNEDTGVRLRQVGEMMDMWRGLHQEDKCVSRSDIAGIRLMRERLGKVGVHRDRI